MTETLQSNNDTLVLLGATATGKTHLGVQLAHMLSGEIISADSRQVYRGLDIGSGKDLTEYVVQGETIPYHLIDCADIAQEYNVFEFQKNAFEAHIDISARGKLPIVVGGTGLYISSVLDKNRMIEVPENPVLRDELDQRSQSELIERLTTLKGKLHNTTDTSDTERLIRAIEIEEFTRRQVPKPAPPINPLILGIRYPRETLHQRIAKRLKDRLQNGMIEEVEALLANGVEPKRLITLGLEYRYITEFLTGTIKNKNDLFQKLLPAIKNFAKRQETWFRRMEKKGLKIHWLETADIATALSVVRKFSAQ